MTRTTRSLLIVLAAAVIGAIGVTRILADARQGPAVAPADLVLRNGRIVTVDDRQPEAQALASRGGKIVFVGANADVARYVGAGTQVIDLAGQLAIPGFIEGHGHFTGVGENRLNLDFMNTKSWDEILHMVAQAVEKAKPGEWIIGRGWHQDKWTSRPIPNVDGFPLHAALDKVSPNNPVVLTHASGHAAFVNAKAMEVSGITKTTPNPQGGDILKDKDGNPTGLMNERAQRLVQVGAGAPRPTPAETEATGRKVLELADDEVITKGITTFHDAGSGPAVFDRVKRLIDEGRMHVRLWMMFRPDSQNPNAQLQAEAPKQRVVGYGHDMLTVRAVKITADGALGSRGAWLLAPYADKPDTSGLVPPTVATLPETAQIAVANNMQLCVHAIGDRANREVLNIYEDAFAKANVNGRALRWRIEHAQHISAADIPRFGLLGVIASMQANHCTSDAVFVPDRLGAARSEEGAYVWQKIMKSGGVVTNGTDAPVENVDPIPNYYSSVTRKTATGQAFYPDQRLSRMEALRAYTILNAYAAFEEDIKGSLSLGKLADITVLTKDITTVPEEQIKTAKVAYTIIGGKVVYKGQ